MSKLLRTATAFTIVGAVVLGMAGEAAADGPTIIGAGSTWSQIAIDQWRSDVNRIGLSVNYQGVGSTQGRALFAGGTIDFGVSEIPYQPEDAKPHRGFSYLPIVAGGTSMMYNLQTPDHQQIRSLTLSATNIALIFTGKITNWSDGRLKRDGNPSLPDLPIRLVVRSDGSGTSAQFTRYLHETVPSVWNAFTKACGVSTPPDGISFYPYGRPGCVQNAIGQRGSDGIANYVSNPGLGLGAIGYVEAAYAISRRMPVVGVKNRSGNFALPTAQNVATALQYASLNNDSTQELSKVYTAPDAFAYPISSYSYMIVPTDGLDPAKGDVLGRFISYFACAGQQSAARLGYSPMPLRLVQFAFAAEKKIPGAPDPPATTASACPNPTITGDFKLGSSVAADNVLPYTDLGQKTFGGDGTGGNGGGSGGGTGTETGTGTGTGSGSGTGTGSGTGGGTGSGAGTGTGGGGLGTSTTETLSPDSLAPLKAAALEKIQGLDDPGRMPLVIGAVVVLGIVLGPVLLRLRR